MNYTTIGAGKKEITAVYKELLKEVGITKKMSSNLEFDLMDSEDQNGETYIYIHLKDYEFDGFFSFCQKFRSNLDDKYPNIICATEPEDRKMLIWVPKKPNVHTLTEDGYNYKSDTLKQIEKSTKKNKNKL